MEKHKPQKLKPATDKKQTAGHSYWTRSKAKAKRTSHCDDESSGSEAHQPPLKRRTRQGAKQAGKSVGINNIDLRTEPLDLNTVDDYASAEIALQNDLVLESLLRYMNRSDLLSCRVVNKQWQYEATKELRRRKLFIRFSFDSEGDQLSRDIAFQDICRRLRECRTPSLLLYFQVKTDDLNDVGTAGVTSIFTTVGNQMKRLALHLNLSRRGYSFGRWSLTTDLQNLLFRHALNLEFLEINFHLSEQWEAELKTVDAIRPDQNDGSKFLQLPNLKAFNVTGKAPPKFFAHVMNAAVNLRSVGIVWSTGSPSAFTKFYFAVLAIFGGTSSLEEYSSGCITYFLGAEGRGKVHVVKRFRIYLTDDYDAEYVERSNELMQKFLTEQKQNLQLETFECDARLLYNEASFAPRNVGVINQILECSSGSLQKLRIEPAKWFVEPLIVPRLPKLQEICFDCFRSSRDRQWALHRVEFFPPGFNINFSFPNVSTIVLLKCSLTVFRHFVSRMGIEVPVPVPSIQRIILIDSDKNDSSVLPPASDFRRVFPNLLSISFVDKEKYYKI